jgi:hypothetical protein
MIIESAVRDSSLELYLDNAHGIAFDTCHKIYVLMDSEQMDLMREYEYDPLISSDEMTPAEMYETVAGWYEESCQLRFIQAVTTAPDNPNEGYVDIVPQFLLFNEDEDED